MSDTPWYYVHNSLTAGPIPQSQLMEMLRSGSLSPQTPVWTAGMKEWAPAATVDALNLSERLWYYVENGASCGPVTPNVLAQMVNAGRPSPNSLVWAEGMAEWAPYSSLRLAPSTPESPPPQSESSGQALTPSEVVMLNGDEFAGESSLLQGGNFELLHKPGKAGYQPLSTAMVTAAFLGLAERGVIRLQVLQKKAMMGLRTLAVVMVEPGQGALPWAPESFEGFIANRVLHGGPADAADLIYEMLMSDSTYPWRLPTMVCCVFLEQRGFLVYEQQKKLGLFKTASPKLAPHTPAVMAACPAGPVKELLEQGRQMRPDLYGALGESLQRAISRRTEYTD